jgi:hypothetical protein
MGIDRAATSHAYKVLRFFFLPSLDEMRKLYATCSGWMPANLRCENTQDYLIGE